ncbi:MAG: class I SAM-dependent methyltransferase [Verrucomicrobiales bacterium]
MNEGFDPSYFPKLASLEAGNFWFRSRNKLIVWAIRRYFPEAADMLEIGCGTGFVLSGIHEAIPALRLHGSEFLADGLPFAASRVPGVELFQMDARKIPFKEKFDLVGAFDVLEHIQEDETVLSEIHQALRSGGGLLVTVPQHPWLWSAFDVFSRHVRRYSAGELKKKVEAAGFRVVRASSFVSLLLPAIVLSRRKPDASAGYDGLKELKKSPAVNFMLERVLDFERQWIRAGVSFPAGGSLLLAAVKKDGHVRA